MKWIAEHKLFSVITGIVVILCLIIIISFLTAGGGTFLGRSINSAASTIEKPLMTITKSVKSNVSGIFSYKKLQKENEELQAKVDKLEQEKIDLKLKKDELKQLKKLSNAFDYEPFQNNSKSVIGRVIELDNSNPYIVFTIDVGKNNKLKKNDIVVDGNGLVGKIQEVGKNQSKVVSILSTNNSISFKVLRKPSITGVLKGNGNGELSGYLMDENSRVLKGDVLVTSGIGIYPEGIKIGKVKSVDYDEDQQLKIVEVKPTVSFNGMQKVAVFYEF